MTLFSLKDLRGNIVWSSAYGSLSLSIKLQFRGKSEISNLELHLPRQEQVTEFEIPMDDSVRMKVFEGCYNLNDVTLDL